MEAQQTNELIRVVQLPVIEDQLRSVKTMVEARTSEAMSLVCTEETLAAVKDTRAELNKQFAELESLRKAVKAQVMKPYEDFDRVYKECVSDAFKAADVDLKGKISDTERGIKQRCEDGLREYFAELCAAYHVDFVTFEQTGVKVDMASAKAKTPKKLRDQLKVFVAEVAADMDMIGGLEHSAEIAAEYKRTLNAAYSIAAVNERHRRIEEEKTAQAAREAARAAEQETAARVDAVAPPTQIQKPQNEIPQVVTRTVRFTVTDTVPRLRALRAWLEGNGYKYE